MRRRVILAAFFALVLAQQSRAQKTEMSWSIDPKTQTHVNIETRIAFPRTVAGFRMQNAIPATLEGTATFTYAGKHGLITVLFVPRAVVGCGEGQDCASPALTAQSGQLKRLHGKHDLQQSFRLQGAGRRRGWGAMYRFVASPRFRGKPAYSETGALEVGNFIYAYQATFTDKAGLDDLAMFLRAFGVTKT